MLQGNITQGTCFLLSSSSPDLNFSVFGHNLSLLHLWFFQSNHVVVVFQLGGSAKVQSQLYGPFIFVLVT